MVFFLYIVKLKLLKQKKYLKKLPLHFYIGLILILISWYLNWSLTGLRTYLIFFPLWLGYILFIDSLVILRKNSSLLKRNWKKFVLLFLISAPAWWLFELLNLRTANWIYVGKEFFTGIEYASYASLSFSTVMPAVFETAELVSAFNWTKHFRRKLIFTITTTRSKIIFVSGIVCLTLILFFPEYFFYLNWLSILLIIEPINIWMKNTSLFDFLSEGNWKPLISLITGCLICGFFWEMWNFYSYPKWIYHLQIANFLHIFEMPVLGYLGYIPFSLELFAIYNFINGLFGNKKDSYLKFE